MKLRQTIFLPLLCLFFFGGQLYAQKNKVIKGNGNIVSENRDLSSFTGVHVGGAFDVVIKKGNSHKAEIEADENLMSHIIMEVKDNTLKIKTEGSVQKVSKLSIVLTMKNLDHLSVSGAADVKSSDEWSSDQFDLSASGASDVDLRVNTDKFKCAISGSSDLELKGKTGDMSVNLSGASDLRAKDFQARSINIQASGSSSAHVYASDALMASASGSSDISCEGSPSKKDVKTSGSADIDVD